MPQVPHIYIVDDDEAFRSAIARLLSIAGYAVATYNCADDFLTSNIKNQLGCILLDYSMPGPNGLELQQTLAERGYSLPIVFLSGCGDVSTAVQAMKYGAIDFLSKPVRQEELLTAIRNALIIQATYFKQHEKLQAWQQMYNTLTPREVQVFEKVVEGKLNKEIADELGTSERTIKAHRASVMQKMQVSSLAQLVQIAVHMGLCNAAEEKFSRTA